jgi:hypothetical protein
MEKFAFFHINKGDFKDTKNHYWVVGYNEGGIGTPIMDVTPDVEWFLNKQKEEAEKLANVALNELKVAGIDGNELILKMRDKMSLLKEIEELKKEVEKTKKIKAIIDREEINCGEDLWQRDSLNEKLPEIMEEICEITGYKK